jgi:hypothetical protein
MKKQLIVLLALLNYAFAQDSTLIISAANISYDTLQTDIKKSADKLKLQDFKKFYIGFSAQNNGIEVITLDIKNIAPKDSAIEFSYTLNTRKNREDGTGTIWPAQSLIHFQNMEDGRIHIPEDGKIVFESISADTLSYWKLKEK